MTQHGTPSTRRQVGVRRALAEALREGTGASDLTARVAAVQMVAVHWALAQDNAARLAYGESADARFAGTVADAEHAFALLENGLRRLPPGQ